jgi:ArsR family transcriptional regulator
MFPRPVAILTTCYFDGDRNRWIQDFAKSEYPQLASQKVCRESRMTRWLKSAKRIGDPNRLAIYTHIAQHDELFCGEMHAKHATSLATLSHHLKVLTELGLITFRKEKLNVYYRSVPERMAQYVQYLTGVATRSHR